ncbi:MAG: histidine--tRNA ligase [Erysipelotrichia bacterium]|nr:histidine--tRNA ligase [Erysipelotrichia bacterium]
MSINSVKGMHDVLGEEVEGFAYIENLLKHISELYAYNEVRPPVIEQSNLFVRSVGQSSDVIRKEMYTFSDKGGRSIALRPEFTAGIIRLMVQHKLLLTKELPVKVYYLGPVFRYERPQLGRYRQFNQFGVEAVGNDSAEIDADVIALAYTMLQSLDLENVIIKINTLGDELSRENYKKALKNYFAPFITSMCKDCQLRYELSPLRILDCKVPNDQEIIKKAPKMKDYLSLKALGRFNRLLSLLEALGIPYEIDDNLVRGLDYYSETVFEFHYVSKSGNDYGAIGAGGHYDKLTKELGGPEMAGIGFSFGIERLYSVLKDDGLLELAYANRLDFYVMPLAQQAQDMALQVSIELRLAGYRTDLCFEEAKLPNMFKRATRKQAKYAIIIGEDEIKKREVVIKNLETQKQKNYGIDKLIENIAADLDVHDHDDICLVGKEG